MNTLQKERISSMRMNGDGYVKIANILGISENTVKSFCQRNHLGGVRAVEAAKATTDQMYCRQCGKELFQMQGRKVRRFCSDTCRLDWWHKHPEQIQQMAIYSFACAGCGETFTAYGNAQRKYCSHSCYIAARFGSGKKVGELG